MKVSVLKATIVILALLLSACSSVGPNGLDTPSRGQPGNADLQQVLALLNQARAEGASCGGTVFPSVAALKYDAALSVPAQKHSEDMAAAKKMSHETPPGATHYPAGSSPWDRLKTEGYSYSAAGENIARGQATAVAVMTAWLDSEGHCRNMMNPNFTVIGLGWQDDYWTQMFARPR